MRAAAREVVNEIISMSLPDYAERFLKIRTKTKGLQPFRFNASQLYLHRKVEMQLQQRGFVRISLLKARQWGGCLKPNTPVLTADLRWVPIDSLSVGDELVACDENHDGGKGASRKMRTSTVEKIWRTHKSSYRITFEDGTFVVCSADHRWLSRKSQPQAEWRSIKSQSSNGLNALKVGDYVRSVTDVWSDSTLDDAWLGGMIDGGGCLNARRKAGGSSLTIAQRAGDVLQRMADICKSRAYAYSVLLNNKFASRPAGKDIPVYVINIGGMKSLFHILGLSRPTRFIGRRWWEGAWMPNNGWKQIESIDPEGEIDLVDIETSTGTYVAKGLMSHNSTYVQGRFYSHIARGRSGVRAFILTHQDQATANIFGMARRFHDNLDPRVRPTSPKPSQKKLDFPRLDSSYAVATAGAKSVGRSDTIQLFHGSEVAYWPNADDHMTGALQAVPSQGPRTEAFLESTGNGQSGAFYWNFTHAMAGLSDFVPVFVPWFWQDEYKAAVTDKLELDSEDELYMRIWSLSLEQMQFRQNKIVEFGGGEAGRSRFAQEYPCTPLEAFSKNIVGGYIEQKYVLMARHNQPHLVSVFGPKIMGIDPAYTGNDRFIVFMRQGRLAIRVGRWTKLRKPQSFGRIVRLIHEYRPDIICIDAGGVGGPFYDDLVPICDKLGIQIIPVLGAERADEPERFRNKRVENASRCRDWFEDAVTPCIHDLAPPPPELGIDGLDEIQADITAPLCDWDTSSRPVIETKKRILTHHVSPDNFDALATTFSLTGLDATWKSSQSEGTTLQHAKRPTNWRAT